MSLDFDKVDELAERAKKPLDDDWLEELNPTGDPYWRFLHLLALELHAETALVIGTWKGGDVAHIARAGAFTTGLDINAQTESWDKIREREWRAHFVVGDSREVEIVPATLDLVFQDSSHHYLPSCEEWDRWWPKVVDGGVWVCDDITPAFWNPDSDPPGLGMVQYFEQRPGRKKLYPNLHWGSVIGVILK